MSEQRDYTGYEYKQVTADTCMESLWKDSLEHFGWTVEKIEAKIVKRLPFALWILAAPLSLLPWRPFQKQLSDHESSKQVEITFKRDRKIARKQELDQLESKFEHCARSIESMNASKGTTAAIASSLVGLLGTACLALATFAYLAGMSPAFIVAAVPGFLGWIIPFFLYRTMKASKERAIAPKIEEQHENIYSLCKSGNEILCIYA
ncbi:hypothetical protein [uncultured Intestinimonas sp.]|uniref:hypothetical protein n=1 Tax=uncultured Intestinimonas sp. TaxID=1689265 RepID=UPI001FA32568|nr:hypothetical protein [uncultured Intestinimonas sp.]HIZ56563.1 hypothetical protein [Bacillota bacterium]HJA37077.1 hypothetical protein [Bacillota bacterium]